MARGTAGRLLCHGMRADLTLTLGTLVEHPSILAGGVHGTVLLLGPAGIV